MRRTRLVALLTLGAVVSALVASGPQAASTTVVINEVDYDQASIDTAEFLELKNVSASAINLDSYVVELVNGNAGGAAIYDTIDLPNVSLAAGDYFVVCANAATVVDCDVDDAPETNFIQNGDPDAIGLRNGGTLVDALSYEGNSGAPYTEGSGAGLVDNPDAGTNGLSRCPDGTDTDVNNVDFAYASSTPGAANGCPAAPIAVEIAEIQGASHTSALVGQAVQTTGIVTALRSSGGTGFYLQDPTADADAETSEAIFVFTGSAPNVAVGDSAEVVGTVAEFRPGGSGSTNLTLTQLSSPTISVLSSGNALPAAAVIGTGGRVPPDAVIDDDATGSVETSGTFDAATDGIDFYESLEGMRAQVNDAVAVGPTNGFGEVMVVGDGGANASIRTNRGGVVISATDFNPERIQLDDTLLPMSVPDVNVGDGFTAPAVGVLDYGFGNFELNVTTTLSRVDRGLVQEVTAAQTDHQIAVATYNVENLDPTDDTFGTHADYIVNHLRSPDLIAIEEIQDSDGPANTDVTDAATTWNMLIAAIVAEGGPTYQFRQINPVDDQDGGEPGGNIRVGFLFRSDRGLEFIARPGGTATSSTTVVDHASGPQLSASPGRIDPGNVAFNSSRKPLAGEFRMRGRKVFVIANHFNSKGGDQPLFGRFQPPARVTEAQRHAQAQIVNDFVDDLVAADEHVNVIVLGDINDFEFSETVEILEGGVLTSLMTTLPKPERYSYVFEGNSQVLDQILVSDSILDGFPTAYDVVHVNSEFADQASDHDPQVARIDFRGRPTP
ncbi:MAG TPA: lamin tail domain-containing protein [Gaiellaceae bacterium]|nr:lamin tail domain-containing protein [Gaiellaceae bacterium]